MQLKRAIRQGHEEILFNIARNIYRRIPPSLRKIIRPPIIWFFGFLKIIWILVHRWLMAIRLPIPEAPNNNKPNIAFQLDSFDKGGLEEVVFTLVKKIGSSGKYNVFIFINNNVVGSIGSKLKDEYPIVLLNNNRYYLQKILKKIPFSLVHLHYSIFGIMDYKRSSVRILYTIHNNYIWADNDFIKTRKPLYVLVDQFAAVSSQVRSHFSQLMNVPLEKITAIPNGLHLEDYQNIEPCNRQNYGFSADDFIFINIASLNWNKYQIAILKAMQIFKSRYPHWKALIVGNVHDLECSEFLKKKVYEYAIEDKVIFLDYVPKEKVLGLLHMADCFLLPSIIEGWSIAVMEAMHCGKPLILSDVGSARDVIKGNDIGIVIPQPYKDITKVSPSVVDRHYKSDANVTNLDALCRAMEEIANNYEQWKIKGEAGKEKIFLSFNSDEMSERYLKQIDCLID